MASREAKEERAEAAARLASEELRDVNREREYGGTTVYKEQMDAHLQQEEIPGVIGSALRAVQGTYEHAKQAVVGKSHDTVDATRETKDATAEKAKEYTDYAKEKAR
ncbi:hypothetical protein SLE2022_112540 [Rubroshorea leprosula]